jgi:GTP 3',8-cyclase
MMTAQEAQIPTGAPRGLLRDSFGRRIRLLRLSLTERCNFECSYCVPPDPGCGGRREHFLDNDGLVRVCRIFSEMGVDRIRLTGGEPTLRWNLVSLVRELASLPGVRELSMSSNGSMLAAQADVLRAAGLDRVNISLPSLDPDRFQTLTGGRLQPVLEGIEALKRLRWTPVGINMVVVRGINDDEVADLVEFFRHDPVEIRFIEYMPWRSDGERRVPWDETRSSLEQRHQLVAEETAAGVPATRFEVEGARCRVATISAMRDHFCSRCDRVRLEADGTFRTCLGDVLSGAPLREILGLGAPDDDVEAVIRGITARKPRFNECRPPRSLTFAGCAPLVVG